MAKSKVFFALEGYRNIETCEDYDFVFRAIFKGFKIGNCPEILLDYRFNLNSISRKNEAKQRIIAKFLEKKYRQKKSCSLNEYNMFIKSKKYYCLMNKELRIQNLKYNFHHSKSKKKKFIYLIQLLFSFTFIKIVLTKKFNRFIGMIRKYQ